MTRHAEGTFEVKMSPPGTDDATTGTAIARFGIDKQFHGDLEGTSKGQMLAVGNPSVSAGYVAMEVISGTLAGHKGTFALQHTGTMTRGVPELSVTVVPDSGTGQFVGISGKMKIVVAGGKHSYEFDYTLASQWKSRSQSGALREISWSLTNPIGTIVINIALSPGCRAGKIVLSRGHDIPPAAIESSRWNLMHAALLLRSRLRLPLAFF